MRHTPDNRQRKFAYRVEMTSWPNPTPFIVIASDLGEVITLLEGYGFTQVNQRIVSATLLTGIVLPIPEETVT